MRPIAGANPVNHRFPSGPEVIGAGLASSAGSGNSVMTPAVVMRPIFPIAFGSRKLVSVNQRLPSGPAASPLHCAPTVGTGNSVTVPVGVIRQTVGPTTLNQRLPSAPAAIAPRGCVGPGNSVTTPAGVIRPTLWASLSVNQRFPSGPATMPQGPLFA